MSNNMKEALHKELLLVTRSSHAFFLTARMITIRLVADANDAAMNTDDAIVDYSESMSEVPASQEPTERYVGG